MTAKTLNINSIASVGLLLLYSLSVAKTKPIPHDLLQNNNDTEASKIYDKMRMRAREYVDKLWIWDQVSLIKELAEETDSIIKYIHTGNGTIKKEGSKQIKGLINIYADNLLKIKKLSDRIYNHATNEIIDTLKFIKKKVNEGKYGAVLKDDRFKK